MRPCQGHFQNRRKCDFLVYILLLFILLHTEVTSVPLLPAQPRAARHKRRCRYPLAVLFCCGAERVLTPAASAHLFPCPRLLPALEGGSLPGILSSPSRRCRSLPAFPKSGGCRREPGPSGKGQTAPQGHGSPCGSRPGSAHLQSPGSTARSLAWGSGPCPGCGVHSRQPPTHTPLQQCRPPLQPAWQERRLPASCPPLKLIPTCAIALINNSAVANYSLSSSLSSSLIPGKQRHLCTDRIVCFSTSFWSFCCSVSLF